MAVEVRVPSSDIEAMSIQYRNVRRAVFKDADNEAELREKISTLCNRANLNRYNGTDRAVARKIWRVLWTTNRYGYIHASIATKEINDIQFVFDDFTTFCCPAWDVEAKGHTLVQAGEGAHDFLKRQGTFTGRQTIPNLPKLKNIVRVARKLNDFLDHKPSNTPVLDFVTGGMPLTQPWAIQGHLTALGYRGELTALHAMMELGFQVVKPDIHLTRFFLERGWLHAASPGLPEDLSADDLEGKGRYGNQFRYTSPRVYRPVIDLARHIANATHTEQLIADTGWATENPIREFDIFVVMYQSGNPLELPECCGADA